MKTKKQCELIEAYLSQLGADKEPVYRELISYLSELGYNPQKEGGRISFKHDAHNKQIAKIGMTRGKSPAPVFMLRFSACKDYSKRFEDIVNAAVRKQSFNESRCVKNECDWCAGEPMTHVYTGVTDAGEVKYHCGASALEIPNVISEDIAEIKRLLRDEHIYLMKHQAGIIIDK